MTLEAGRRLGAYEVLSPLGAGGMGEVYRARDTRLGREVAIKVLPEALSADRERLGRFEQEARAASALNHPNIVTIHEVGFEGELPYLAMELVDGKSLRELVVSGALPVRRVLAIATQIAEGLAKAHAAGIVHRDLKPENVMVSKDGFVKILDFGLAKLAEPQSGGVSAMPTLARPETRPGVVLGTVGYMSPEQASGEPLDYRSDQFSLGTMLYEMATGEKAFQRKTAAETMSAIIREEPEPVSKLRPEVPAPLRWILERCLAKDREERYTSTRDLARELAGVRDHISEIGSGAEAPLPGRAASRRRLRGVAAAVLVFAAGGVVAWLLWRERPAAAGAPTFQRLTFQKLGIANARFAPDGTTVLYGATINGRAGLYQVRVGSPESQLIDIGSADILAISSGGEMAVRVGNAPTGTLAKMPLLGGAPRPVVENVLWSGADWTPDGKDLVVVRRVEGRDRLEFPIGNVLLPNEAGCPRFSPRGDWIAFSEGDHVTLIGRDGKGKRALTLGSPAATCPLAWRPDGREIWFSGKEANESQALYAVDLAGQQRLVARVPGDLELFDISRDGRVLLAHHSMTRVLRGVFPGHAEETDLAWLDGSIPAQISADGSLLLFTEDGEGSPGAPSVYMRKTDGSPAVRLGKGIACALSPDHQWVLARIGGESPHLAILPRGTGQTRELPNDAFEAFLGGAWLPEGRSIVFAARENGGGTRVYRQELDGGKPRAITPSGFRFANNSNPVSPDGKFLFATDGSGNSRIFPLDGGDPRPIPGLGVADQPMQWSTDGKAMYVVGLSDLGIWRLDLRTGRRQLVRRLVAATFGPARAVMTPDGRYYAFGFAEVSSALYLVDGLR